jgi:hypothetical protein
MDITYLFGTKEYFESEFIKWVSRKERTMEDVYEELQSELLNDFMCDDKLRIECLSNLTDVYEKITCLSSSWEVKRG